uniref:Uncharacterized protein n=1 Tax=Cacopsylla melanoneura TaxID=428564 RepID=A0A8D9F4N2_9HEMI
MTQPYTIHKTHVREKGYVNESRPRICGVPLLHFDHISRPPQFICLLKLVHYEPPYVYLEPLEPMTATVLHVLIYICEILIQLFTYFANRQNNNLITCLRVTTCLNDYYCY